jgi:hypothetical protein
VQRPRACAVHQPTPGRVGNKKPTQKKPIQKTPPKKTTKNGNKKPTQKTHPKKPVKMFFLGFLYFLFFMKIKQTFLFETDF